MKKIIIGLLIAGVFLFAGEFGRITGRVIDKETGEPLIGADVIIEGSELGAATDENGEFVILYVPAGTYRVTASYISYDPYTYKNVVVNTDQTTALNFKLTPTVITVKGVTVEAEREIIVRDQVHTRRSVTAKEMERLPVTTINQVITLQAGVVQSGLGTHIRGGRGNEVAYFVDGIITKVPNTGYQSARISPNAVEEVDVETGGFDAEYGDALSGVVNIVTKEGGPKFAGNFRYLTDEVFSAVDAWKNKLNYGYNLYNLSLGGPVPKLPRFRYFLSGELMLTDSWVEAYYRVPSPRMDYRSQAKFSYHLPNAKGKITLSAHNSREQFVYWRSGNLKYFNHMPMSRIKNSILSATFNYMLTAQTLVSVKGGWTHYNRAYGNRDYAWEDSTGRAWYEDYRFCAEHLIPLLLDDATPDSMIRHIVIDSMMQYHTQYTNRGVAALRNNPYGVEGMYYTYGDYRVWRYWWNQNLQVRADISHSVGKIHEFKSGFDVIQYRMKFFDNNLPWVSNPFWDYYDRSPIQLAGYIQDKMDFEGLIARVGFRFDYFDPKAFTFKKPSDFLNDTLVNAPGSYKISPRLGFSLPVTDRMKFRFDYGHYFQLPALDNMYSSTDTSVIRALISRGNAVIGNVFIKPQKTVKYEFGMEDQLTDDMAFSFSAYFKDIYDLSQIREVIALPTSYFQFKNVDYGNVKGFEFTLSKRMSNMWALGITYTLQFAKGTAAYASEWYYDNYYYGVEPPVIDYWLDFDERHIVNANFDLSLPEDFFFIPLQNLNSSWVFSFHSGHPYTPEDLRGNRLGDENSARMPGYWNVDWSFSRLIKLGPLNLTLESMIYNLFNTDQVIDVYSTTGEPDNHGDPEPSIGQFGYISIASSHYSPQADYNHDGLINPYEQKRAYIAARNDYYIDPRNHNGPFRMRLGIGIGF